MIDVIQLLPDSVANQIAAGEVIQRPAAVIKELVENAIDAGATSIQVILKDAGRTLIQVIDNGKGMSVSDARMAFERHATSKIKKAEDLFSLQTMGFRGEALASIAAIAQVELRTRRSEDEVGTCVRISGSEVEAQEVVSCDVGSNFQVKNIFFNVPARRKFLKSNQTEMSNIVSEFERIALVNPNVAFALYHNDNEILNLASANLRQRIINVFGKALNQQLLTVDVDSSLISVSGYIGNPKSARKKNALQYFFVNGRYMRHPYFSKAVMQSYEQLIPQGEQPNFFLYLNVDPANIDVNIHPTKTEIKFENESFLWQIINASVKEALGKYSAVPSIDFDMADAPEIPAHHSSPSIIQPPKPKFDTAYNPFDRSSSRPDPNWQKMYGGFSDSSDTGETPFNPFNPQPTISAHFDEGNGFEGDPDYFHTDTPFPIETQHSGASLPLFDADAELNITVLEIKEIPSALIGSSANFTLEVEPTVQHVFPTDETSPGGQHYQFKGKYICTSVKSGLMMIDQHRAHIRVLFDQYIHQISNKQGVSQGVIFPEIVNFTPSEIPILESILEDLHFLGFELNNMGGCAYALNGVPAGIEGVDVAQLVHDMVDAAINKAGDVKANLHEMTALKLAEAASIPYGQLLSNQEMDKLIDNLFASVAPNYTPDGKTILSVISNDEIGKRFK